jgi:membrane protein
VRFWQRWLHWFDSSDATLARWVRAAREALFGEMPVLAAGTALFAIISTVPVLLAVVSIYGLIADASQIHQQLHGLETVLPADVVTFIGDQLERQAKRTSGELGIAIAGGVIAAVYSARGTARAMIDALNRAYRVRERRGRLAMLAITIAMAIATLIGLTVLFGASVALPGILAMVDLNGYGLVHWLRWPVLIALIFVALLGLYRFAPSPRPLTRRHLWPGAAIASLLLIAVSGGLSLWVTHVAAYELFYGAFGSVIVILLWFYLSVITLVIGGFVNAELERHAGAPAPDRSMY